MPPSRLTRTPVSASGRAFLKPRACQSHASRYTTALLPNSTKLANLKDEMSYKDKLWRGVMVDGSWVYCTCMLFHMSTYSRQTQRGAWLCCKSLQFLIAPRLCFQMHPAQQRRYCYQAVILFLRL